MDIQQLVNAAQEAMRAGRREDAERLWDRVLAASPNHPQGLFYLAQQKMLGRNPAAALPLLERAAKADPAAPAIPLNISFAHRALGNSAGEFQALDRALSIDPYYLPALLSKAAALERAGRPRQAARVHKDALSIAPPDDQLPSELRSHMATARAAVARNAAELEKHLASRLKPQSADRSPRDTARVDLCKEALLGRKKIYTQQPTMLHFPGLPAIQFYDAELFPWLRDLEEQCDVIRTELLGIIDPSLHEFRPYVQHPAGAPLNQWEELNYSPKWSAYFLWEDGKKNEAHCERCPRTAAIAQSLPLADIPGYAPAVFFSVLEPHTRIPPHTGVTNIRAIVHLPLIVPGQCGFRVGNDSRPVEPGKAWVFDDTIEHEAWNESEKPRIILIFDIWNPYLTPTERELTSGLLDGVREYYLAG